MVTTKAANGKRAKGKPKRVHRPPSDTAILDRRGYALGIINANQELDNVSHVRTLREALEAASGWPFRKDNATAFMVIVPPFQGREVEHISQVGVVNDT